MQRYTTLAEDFKRRYNESPKLFARAPGRVNLIGEHIDYEGYGVLPMAISRDTVVAISLAGASLDVSNHDDASYPAYSFVPDPTQLVDIKNHVWANYALAAYKGVHDYLDANPSMHTPISQSFPGIKVCPQQTKSETIDR
jgi:N-acetylgalactosamine kinase